VTVDKSDPNSSVPELSPATRPGGARSTCSVGGRLGSGLARAV
jgi:hypothetical protein